MPRVFLLRKSQAVCIGLQGLEIDPPLQAGVPVIPTASAGGDVGLVVDVSDFRGDLGARGELVGDIAVRGPRIRRVAIKGQIVVVSAYSTADLENNAVAEIQAQGATTAIARGVLEIIAVIPGPRVGKGLVDTAGAPVGIAHVDSVKAGDLGVKRTDRSQEFGSPM